MFLCILLYFITLFIKCNLLFTQQITEEMFFLFYLFLMYNYQYILNSKSMYKKLFQNLRTRTHSVDRDRSFFREDH